MAEGEDVWGRLRSLQGRPLPLVLSVVKQEEVGTASQPPALPSDPMVVLPAKVLQRIDRAAAAMVIIGSGNGNFCLLKIFPHRCTFPIKDGVFLADKSSFIIN